jgi:hypothetical protein
MIRSVPSAGLVRETQAMAQEQPGHGGLLRPLALLRKFVPVETASVSDRLGWSGLEAARYRAAPDAEFQPPATTHHLLFLFARPPEELDLVYEGVKRHVPPPAGSISLIPAGGPSR